MTKRSYHQYCPIAYSLDVIGERWTLLIIRELIMGPRRFTDLLQTLDGIGPHLLSKRLKHLREHEMIVQEKLPPPSSGMIYKLTARGQGLKGIMVSLADWGMEYMPPAIPDTDTPSVSSTMLGMENRFFQPDLARGMHLSCQLFIGEEVFYAHVMDGELDIQFGVLTKPDLAVKMELPILLALMTQTLSLEDAISSRAIAIECGEQAQFVQFLSYFLFV